MKVIGIPARLIRILVPHPAQHCHPAGDTQAEDQTELPPKFLALGLRTLKVPIRIRDLASALQLQTSAVSKHFLCPPFSCACPSRQQIMASMLIAYDLCGLAACPLGPRLRARFCSSLGLVLGCEADTHFVSVSVHTASLRNRALASTATAGLTWDGVCPGAREFTEATVGLLLRRHKKAALKWPARQLHICPNRKQRVRVLEQLLFLQ